MNKVFIFSLSIFLGILFIAGCSEKAASKPSVPINLQAIAGNKQVTLTWNKSAGAANYNVYTATTTAGPYSKVASSTMTSYTVTGLSSMNGPTYYFVVTAVNHAGESAYSNEASSVAFTINPYNLQEVPTSIAIDGSGNVWIPGVFNNVFGRVTELSPIGTTLGYYTVGGIPGGIAINSSGNVWITMGNAVTELSPMGITIGTYSIESNPGVISIDSSDNVWIINGTGYPLYKNTITELSPTGTTITTVTLGAWPVNMAILGGNGGVLIINRDSTLIVVSPTGQIVEGPYYVNSYPWSIALDPSNNIWVTNPASNIVTEISPSLNSIVSAYPIGFGTAPGNIAIDSAGDIWITDGGGYPNYVSTVTELSSTGTIIHTYRVGSNIQPDCIAIDPSGNVWVTNPRGGGVIELVGVAQGPQYFPYTGPQWP